MYKVLYLKDKDSFLKYFKDLLGITTDTVEELPEPGIKTDKKTFEAINNIKTVIKNNKNSRFRLKIAQESIKNLNSDPRTIRRRQNKENKKKAGLYDKLLIVKQNLENDLLLANGEKDVAIRSKNNVINDRNDWVNKYNDHMNLATNVINNQNTMILYTSTIRDNLINCFLSSITVDENSKNILMGKLYANYDQVLNNFELNFRMKFQTQIINFNNKN